MPVVVSPQYTSLRIESYYLGTLSQRCKLQSSETNRMTQLATNLACLVADLDHYVRVAPSGYPRKNVRSQAFQTLHGDHCQITSCFEDTRVLTTNPSLSNSSTLVIESRDKDSNWVLSSRQPNSKTQSEPTSRTHMRASTDKKPLLAIE